MSTIQDRIRIPWRGGAKKISIDTIIAIILVPLLLLLAAVDYLLGILVLIIFLPLLNILSNYVLKHNPRTKFFSAWAAISAFIIAVIFEVKVIAFLEILPEENVCLALLFSVTLVLIYVVRSRAPKTDLKISLLEEANEADDDENLCMVCKKRIVDRMHHCGICQICVPEMDFHCHW